MKHLRIVKEEPSKHETAYGKRKGFGYGVDEALLVGAIVLGIVLALGVWKIIELVRLAL